MTKYQRISYLNLSKDISTIELEPCEEFDVLLFQEYERGLKNRLRRQQLIQAFEWSFGPGAFKTFCDNASFKTLYFVFLVWLRGKEKEPDKVRATKRYIDTESE